VLDRIPRKLKRYSKEILIIDNASTDRTYLTAINYKRMKRLSKITVIKNEINLGYGGSQKKAYQYAIDKGYDIIVMLHGDAQYAPERLVHLLSPLLKGEADMVFGSRMASDPLGGGMPLWRYIGNRSLTNIENTVLGTNLSEFHSGYRAYNCHSLKKIPFHLCSDGFLFDTDIIIQFVIKRMKIAEVGIPTHYGKESKSITAPELVKYTSGILSSLFHYLAHKYRIKKSRKFSI